MLQRPRDATANPTTEKIQTKHLLNSEKAHGNPPTCGHLSDGKRLGKLVVGGVGR